MPCISILSISSLMSCMALYVPKRMQTTLHSKTWEPPAACIILHEWGFPSRISLPRMLYPPYSIVENISFVIFHPTWNNFISISLTFFRQTTVACQLWPAPLQTRWPTACRMDKIMIVYRLTNNILRIQIRLGRNLLNSNMCTRTTDKNMNSARLSSASIQMQLTTTGTADINNHI